MVTVKERLLASMPTRRLSPRERTESLGGLKNILVMIKNQHVWKIWHETGFKHLVFFIQILG